MSSQISNEMLYDLIRDFKGDVNRRFESMERNMGQRFALVDHRFDQIDKRLDQMDRRLDHIERRLDHIEAKLEEHDRKFGNVNFGFSRTLALFYAFLSAMISGTVSYTISR